MRSRISQTLVAAVCVLAIAAGCRAKPERDDENRARSALHENGYGNVTVREDSNNKLITLGGHVDSEAGKTRAAEVVARAVTGLTIANQITVEPPGEQRQARKTQATIDHAIHDMLLAELAQNGLSKQRVKVGVRSGVVLLTGTVDTEEHRLQIERIAARIPQVQQLVDQLQVQSRQRTPQR
jgi:osmotically-inducible protein OsmY